jgi:predicted small metal-binding protein
VGLEVLEVLDAIHEHVEQRHTLTRVEVDGRGYTVRPDR